MIDANQYRVTAVVVTEAIDLSVRGDGEIVTVGATGHVYDAVERELGSECEARDGSDFHGVNVEGRHWTVRLVPLP